MLFGSERRSLENHIHRSARILSQTQFYVYCSIIITIKRTVTQFLILHCHQIYNPYKLYIYFTLNDNRIQWFFDVLALPYLELKNSSTFLYLLWLVIPHNFQADIIHPDSYMFEKISLVLISLQHVFLLSCPSFINLLGCDLLYK